MNKTGFGLLNRNMIAAALKKWREGGVALLHVRFADGASGRRARQALPAWIRGRRDVFWSERLAEDFYLLLVCPKDEAAAAEQLQRTKQEADRLLLAVLPEGRRGGKEARPYRIGFELLKQAQLRREAEEEIYRALRNAAESAVRALSAAAQEPRTGRIREMQAFPSYGIGRLASPFPVFRTDQRVAELKDFFRDHPEEQGAVVVRESKPVGLLMKDKLHQLLSGTYGLPLYLNREIERVMDAEPLIVDAELPVEQASQLAMARKYAQLYDVVIITADSGSRLLGAASIRSILESITALRTEEARTANPLTGLPGNVSIGRHIRHRLDAGGPFALIYADIDYFKWYNDSYGFALGDEMIRFLARVLQESSAKAGPAFIGHIGGDDFIVVTEPHLAEELCGHILRNFEDGVGIYYPGGDAGIAKDRHGRAGGQAGVSLSLALLIGDGGAELTTERLSRLAADVKKRAKRMSGSSCVKEYIR